MEKINAVITGIGGYVPEYVLNNDELSRMVDTNDEWIMTRIGVKERRILNEEGLGTSYMARKAAKQLLQKTGVIGQLQLFLTGKNLYTFTGWDGWDPEYTTFPLTRSLQFGIKLSL